MKRAMGERWERETTGAAEGDEVDGGDWLGWGCHFERSKGWD